MPLVVGLVLMTLAAVLAVLWPVLRRQRLEGRAPYDLAVYKDQLAEIERDRARGLIRGEEAGAARLEIERRLLRAAAGTRTGEGKPRRASRATALIASLLLPLLTLGLYWRLGEPNLPDLPFAARPQATAADDPGSQIREMVGRLETRLRDQPDDAQGWLLLGRSRGVLGDAPGAIAAFRTALRLKPDEPDALGGLAEALVGAAEGVVTPEAASNLERLAQVSPADPRSGYYLGLAAAQAGDNATALQRWQAILAAAPAGVPWRSRVEDAVRGAARELGLDPATVLAQAAPPATSGPPAAAPGPSAADVEASNKMSPEERLDFIRSMVGRLEARLAEDGNDIEGWRRLAQARMVLGERDEARHVYERALALHKDEPGLMKGQAELMLGPPDPGTGLPAINDEALGIFRRVDGLLPDDPETQWYLGIRALQDGDRDAARGHWQRVLAKLEPASPDYAAIKERLQGLGG